MHYFLFVETDKMVLITVNSFPKNTMLLTTFYILSDIQYLFLGWIILSYFTQLSDRMAQKENGDNGSFAHKTGNNELHVYFLQTYLNEKKRC